jgi:hypothetical protein
MLFSKQTNMLFKKKKKEIFLTVGDIFPIDIMTTVAGKTLNLKNADEGIVHIYFGRYSGCVRKV